MLIFFYLFVCACVAKEMNSDRKKFQKAALETACPAAAVQLCSWHKQSNIICIENEKQEK